MKLVLLACVPCVVGFFPAQLVRSPSARTTDITMKKTWSRRETLAEKGGGLDDKGAEAVGLIGTIPVEFEHGDTVLKTMAMPGQPLSEVASQAGQYVKYKCKKGECGTCEVRVDGQWVRTCVSTVPYVDKGETYKVHVRTSMKKGKKSSRFFSIRSFYDGARNNILGMIGFVKEGRKSKDAFEERIDNEKKLMEEVARRKALKKAQQDVQ